MIDSISLPAMSLINCGVTVIYAVSILVKMRVFLFSLFRSFSVRRRASNKPSLLLEYPPDSCWACCVDIVVSAPWKVRPVALRVERSTGSLK